MAGPRQPIELVIANGKKHLTKAEILGGEIDVRANFGQTVKVTVSPDPYMGDTEVTPSDQTQVLATKKKFVQDDITVLPAPTEALLATENGTFTPSEGKVGFSEVIVDVPDKYLIAEWTEESENLAFCNYWTGKIPNRDESNYNYILLFYGNTHTNGVQLLIYGLQSNGDVIAVRFNNFRIIDNVKPNDSNIYALYVSAGTRVRLFKIPKITS